MQESTWADVVQRLLPSCGNVRGSSDGSLRKLVIGPASTVVSSVTRFGWQVLSDTELGTHKGVLSFASVGHGELHAVL